MVLADLGLAIKGALQRIGEAPLIDQEAIDALLKDVSKAMIQSDVNIQLVKKLRDKIGERLDVDELASGYNRERIVQRAVVEELCALLDTDTKPFIPKKGRPNVIMLVGLQGNGKTTTATKLAKYYNRKGWRTGLVCADTFRAGAFDQLKQNALKCKIPFYGSYSEMDPVAIAREGVDKFKEDKYEIIIVDTSGRHKQEDALFKEMEQVSSAVAPDDIMFVMDATVGQAAVDQARAFRDSVAVGSVVITKLDGHAKGGGALSAVAATGCPIAFIGTGEHFDDFEPFSTRPFVQRLLGMGDVMGLLDKFEGSDMGKRAPELIGKMTQGQFSLRDTREIFANFMEMGSMDQLMSMIPGFGSGSISKNNEHQAKARIKMFMCIMDSMTNDELDGIKKLESSRIQRVARGSGRSAREVDELLTEWKRLSKTFAKIGKTGMLKTSKTGEVKSMARNMNMDQMMRAIDPRILKQMGGSGGMRQMMSQMGGMDLGALSKLGGI